MKSFTIHGVEGPLAELIKAKAASEGLSINKTLKKVLEEYFGVRLQPDGKRRDEFEPFSGLWTQSDLEEFEKRTSDLSEIDPSDWQ